MYLWPSTISVFLPLLGGKAAAYLHYQCSLTLFQCSYYHCTKAVLMRQHGKDSNWKKLCTKPSFSKKNTPKSRALQPFSRTSLFKDSLDNRATSQHLLPFLTEEALKQKKTEKLMHKGCSATVLFRKCPAPADKKHYGLKINASKWLKLALGKTTFVDLAKRDLLKFLQKFVAEQEIQVGSLEN